MFEPHTDQRPKSVSAVRTTLFTCLLAGLLSGCASLPGSLGSRPDPCLPYFAYAGGWLGGDSVYSIPVPGGEAKHETIWVFGDTYVGEPGARDREGSTFIHNSVARSSCRAEGEFELDYAWKTDEDGAPAAVFESQSDRHYMWPFDGFFLGDTLYVLLLEIRKEALPGPLGLRIAIEGTWLARVENPEDPAAYWRTDSRRIVGDGVIASTAAWVERGFVHLMTTTDDSSGTHPRFLVRIPTDAIEAWEGDLGAAAETFTNRGAWEPGIHPGNARLLMRDNATEMSLDRDEETGRYFVVYGAPLQTADDGSPSPSPELDGGSIFMRTSISLTGPWSKRRRIHVMPEVLEPEDTKRAGIRICYAAKAHSEHSPPGVLVASYVCNLAPGANGDSWGVLEIMQTEMSVYRPRVILHPRRAAGDDPFAPLPD